MPAEVQYTLLIADPRYSTWSVRGWLLFEKFGIQYRLHTTTMYCAQFREDLANFAPARTVPAVKFSDGLTISDSLAIAEELASRHSECELWPHDIRHRAIARHLAAEMHSSFMALRNHCPMNLQTAYSDCAPTDEVLADLNRLEKIWSCARTECNSATPWLCGTYSVADVMFAPLAARIVGYGLPQAPVTKDYVAAHIKDDAFRRWRTMALARPVHHAVYDRDYPQQDFPMHKPSDAHAVEREYASQSVNAQCPYSGDVVTDFLEFRGKVYGFCNPFCRDKTMHDPEAWPQFRALAGF